MAKTFFRRDLATMLVRAYSLRCWGQRERAQELLNEVCILVMGTEEDDVEGIGPSETSEEALYERNANAWGHWG